VLGVVGAAVPAVGTAEPVLAVGEGAGAGVPVDGVAPVLGAPLGTKT
jgi:hypothetical protein